jgi:hypothetical protein
LPVGRTGYDGHRVYHLNNHTFAQYFKVGYLTGNQGRKKNADTVQLFVKALINRHIRKLAMPIFYDVPVH